jgi:hypothetical protein
MIDETSYRNILKGLKKNYKIKKSAKPALRDFKILRMGPDFKINYAWSLDDLPLSCIVSLDNSYFARPAKPTNYDDGIERFKTFCCLVTSRHKFEDSLIREREFGDKIIQIFKKGKFKIKGYDYLNKNYEIESKEDLKFINWIITYKVEDIFEQFPRLEIEFKDEELLIYFHEPINDLMQVKRLIDINKILKDRNAI